MDCLAFTGSNTGWPIVIGFSLLTIGAAFIAIHRRSVRSRVGAVTVLALAALIGGGLISPLASTSPAHAAATEKCVTFPTATPTPTAAAPAAVPDFTPTISASAAQFASNPDAAATPQTTQLSIGVSELLGVPATGPLDITLTWPTWLNGQPPTITGAGWTLTSAGPSTAELHFSPTLAANSSETSLKITLSVTASTVGPKADTAVVTIHTASAGDSVATNNTATTTLSVTGVPDLTPVIAMDSNNFGPGETKTFVVYLSEILGYPTTSGTVVFRVAVPPGYALMPYETGATTAAVTGGDSYSVDNSNFAVAGRENGRAVNLIAKAGISIPANGVVFFKFQIKRTTILPNSVSNIVSNIFADGTDGYDSNTANNLYNRVITSR